MLPLLRNKNCFPSFRDEFLGKEFFPGFFETAMNFGSPAVNVIESKNDFTIEVAAPGYNKEDFKIEIDNSILKISCEKESKNEEKDERYMRCEFSNSSFKRSFSLPETASSDKITASYQNGILSVNIPKKEKEVEKPLRQIEIA